MITGPSGAGKGTLISSSPTGCPSSRSPSRRRRGRQRPGEEDGREYWFLTEAEFTRRIDEGDFLEHVQYVGGATGRSRSEIDRIADEGRVCVLELEIEGALRVQEQVRAA